MMSSLYLRTRFLSLMVLTLSVTACKSSQDGSVGPQGAAGVPGPKGDTGATGTANVIYSTWTSVTFVGNGSTYTGTLPAASITQDVLDKADIRVYWKDSDRVVPLPYAQTIGATTYTVHVRFYLGHIDFLANYALTPQPMRYVIIPGSTPGGRKDAVDLSDYAAVKARYHLPD